MLSIRHTAIIFADTGVRQVLHCADPLSIYLTSVPLMSPGMGHLMGSGDPS
jgi:hypothetical protein